MPLRRYDLFSPQGSYAATREPAVLLVYGVVKFNYKMLYTDNQQHSSDRNLTMLRPGGAELLIVSHHLMVSTKRKATIQKEHVTGTKGAGPYRSD